MTEPTDSSAADQPSGTRYVDWDFAKVTGRRLVNAGPKVTRNEAVEIVADLREAAMKAHEPVASTSRLTSPAEAAPVLVVDRPGWIDANVSSLAALMNPVIDKVASGVKNAPSPGVVSIGSKVTGAETGALMAFLASKVLGQYDLAPHGNPRLMLVAPNIVQTERELEVDPSDFRLWVAMHEETHRVQFTAVPWLRDHMIRESQDLSIDLAPTPAELAERLQEIVRRIPEAFAPGSTGLAEVFLTPEQKDKVASITAIMSLLEGHADVVMDDVGPSVIPSVSEIREKFTKRRNSLGSLDRFVRRLLGFEAKMRQYKDGATFVRGVIDRVGLDDFNTVWSSPETLPTFAEIGDPQKWIARVHGR